MGGQGQRTAQAADQGAIEFVELRFGQAGRFEQYRPAAAVLARQFKARFRRGHFFARMGGNGGHIVGPPFQFAAERMRFHRQIEDQGKTVSLILLGRLHQALGDQGGVLQVLVRRFIDQEGTMHSGIRHPRGRFRPHPPDGVNKFLFCHNTLLCFQVLFSSPGQFHGSMIISAFGAPKENPARQSFLRFMKCPGQKSLFFHLCQAITSLLSARSKDTHQKIMLFVPSGIDGKPRGVDREVEFCSSSVFCSLRSFSPVIPEELWSND